MILRAIERFIPKKIYRTLQPAYHFLLALAGAILYRFPSKQIRIVAITGTKGKTSIAEMVNAILEEAGHKTALGGSLRFKIGDESKQNPYSMSMPGRSFLQSFLRKAVKQGCDWAILEMTSEGAKQFRHKFIFLDAFIFTNLAPEHIESHGSFEKYLEHKKRIASLLNNRAKKVRTVIVNADDSYAEEFIPKGATQVIKVYLKDGEPWTTNENGMNFSFDGNIIHSPLKGEFNIMNALESCSFAKSIGIGTPVLVRAFSKLSSIRGRVEHITLPQNHPLHLKQNFTAIVDYAHTIESLEALYKTFPNQRKICVLGNTGGGRDIWKRKGMAKIADKYCDEIILTTEDPYNESPMKIIEDMKVGITKHKPKTIVDRREAIHEAIKIAREGDVVLATGMGSQQYMCVTRGEKIPWDDANVIREEIERKLAPES